VYCLNNLFAARLIYKEEQPETGHALCLKTEPRVDPTHAPQWLGAETCAARRNARTPASNNQRHSLRERHSSAVGCPDVAPRMPRFRLQLFHVQMELIDMRNTLPLSLKKTMA